MTSELKRVARYACENYWMFKRGSVLGSRFLRGFNVFAASSRFRYRQTVGAQALEMELGGSTNVGKDFLHRLARCDAPRKVGNIC